MTDIFRWRGRIGRLRYFFYSLLPLALMLLGVIPLMLEIQAIENSNTGNPSIGSILFLVITVGISSWVAWTASIRRLHDLNLSGWWSLVVLLPSLFASSPSIAINLVAAVAGIVWWGFLLFTPGKADSNRFGPSPGVASSERSIYTT